MDTGQRRATVLTEEGRALLRAEAFHQLRWQQQAWVRILSAHTRGTSPLVAPRARAEIDASLNLLRDAGEEIPPQLSHRGSFVQHRVATGSVSVGDFLVVLAAAIDRVLTQCDGHASSPSMPPAIIDWVGGAVCPLPMF